MKYGILPHITEKKIYFADIGDLVDFRYDLDDARHKLDDFFNNCLEEIIVDNDVDKQIYKEMTAEYERIEHLQRCVNTRLASI